MSKKLQANCFILTTSEFKYKFNLIFKLISTGGCNTQKYLLTGLILRFHQICQGNH